MQKSKRIRALDSIRGLLLFQMILDHFSGPISKALYQCFGFFSAAEGFFFLSGFVGMIAVVGKSARGEDSGWMRRRAFRIWKYHVCSVALLSLFAFFFFPSIRHFFSGLYAHPLSGTALVCLLAYTPEWLDVLPLYVFLLLLGSFLFPRMAEGKWTRILLLSFAVWVCGKFALRRTALGLFPAWIFPGDFDLFSWQFVYFLGAACGCVWKKGKLFSADSKALDRAFPVACALCAFCFLWKHAFLGIPAPGDFWISKEHVGILRLLNFLAFVCIVSFIVRHRPSLLDFSFCAVVGRHSLEVYSAHTVLVYLWMALPGWIQYRSPWNFVSPLLCCAAVWALAKFLEKS